MFGALFKSMKSDECETRYHGADFRAASRDPAQRHQFTYQRLAVATNFTRQSYDRAALSGPRRRHARDGIDEGRIRRL
ncbi:hypothetical protein EVAR_58030_1 [Eumeta japonica]|uniref:Uncharacterized protein n=1 Tax=Eumeta variegata TaxID=151549 RepID=A0A4C1ZMA9_EUMVA|nr:hypothetical protein EVAR_58030_1 [Eumeta japonica]